ncbi:MAG: acyl-CoA thioesterase [Bacteroidetes bacterium]|nr:acyl-CoA thioesterase [Bacteroidota bacterium]
MFQFKRRINFYDCDPAGILFYGRIYEICHEAYEAMIESFNLRESYWINENFIVPIIHSEAKYRKPLRAGETIEIEITVTILKESSFELTYLFKNSKGEITNNVRTVHVFVNKADWKKMKITDEIKEGLFNHFVE